MIDTSALKTAYEALRDFLAAQRLYDDVPTGAFDRTQLARLFTAYYDAEAQTLCVASETRTDLTAGVVLDDMAQKLGYDDYGQLAGGETIIEDGKIRTGLLDVDNIEARKVRVTDATGGLITILPDEGMRLYELAVGEASGKIETQLTASFSGRKVTSLSKMIPENANIPIDEKLVENIALNTNGLLLMGSGVVNGSVAVPVTYTVPSLDLMLKVDYMQLVPGKPGLQPGPDSGGTLDPEPTYVDAPSPVTITVTLRVNNRVKTTIEKVITHFMVRYSTRPDPLDRPILDRTYVVDEFERINVPEYIRKVTSRNANVKVELEYSVTTPNPQLLKGFWQISAAARKPGAEIDAKPLDRDLIQVGGEVFNASFFGNALLFSQATTQFAGLATPKDGPAELIVRSGEQGFRADGAGQRRWSNKRQEWIPADGVLFRGYSLSGRKDALRVWSYNGKVLNTEEIKEGTIRMTFPAGTFKDVMEYYVRTNPVVMEWRDQPAVCPERNTADSFWLTSTACTWGCVWQGFMFEVIYTGDWW